MTQLIYLAFVAFAISMPFEAGLLVGGEGRSSASRLVGFAFLGVALLRPGMCFRKPPTAFWWFALYLGLYVLFGFYQPAAYWPAISSIIFRLAQFLVMFWVEYNLFQNERVGRWCLWGFSLASVVVGCLQVAGVGVSDYRGVVGRQTVFGQNPNTIGAVIALGAVSLIGMAYGRTRARLWTKLVAWGGFLIVAAAITRSGSRGALVGLAAGLMTLLVSRGSAKTRMRNMLVAVVALAACVWITMASATSAARWNRTLQEGNVAGRDRIFRVAIRMVAERPILGWGPVTNYYEIGRRLSLPTKDPHNFFLWLLTEMGLVGTIPFCIGLAMCLRAAWLARKGTQGLLPLALLLAVFAVNLSGTHYVTKWFWLILAYSIASEKSVRRRMTRPKPVSASRPGFGLTPGALPAARVRNRNAVAESGHSGSAANKWLGW